MKIYADYLRKSVEQVGPTLSDSTEQRTAENLLELLTPESVTEGMRIDFGKNPERLDFFNKLHSLQAGVRDGALKMNQIINHHGQNTCYSGRMTPVVERHSLIDGLMYSQSTSWATFQHHKPLVSSVIHSKLIIAEPTRIDDVPVGDTDQPFISVDGTFKYSKAERATFRQLSKTLYDINLPKRGADLTSKLHFGHPSFAAFALERHIESEGVEVVPDLPKADLSLSIGKPLMHWVGGAHYVQHERTYTLRNGAFIEQQTKTRYEEEQAS